METNQKIRVVILDDLEVVRIGVRAALERNGRIEIVAEDTTEIDVLRLVNTHCPDVLLLGLNTITTVKRAPRDLSTFDTIRRLAKNGQTKILVLSRHGQKGLVHTMLHAGASGFMLKDEAMNCCKTLAQAVLDIARKHKLPISHSLYEKLFLPGPETDDVPRLTKRRIEIMQAIADNPHLTLAQVAGLLGIAESTLRNNLSAISQTMGTPNMNGAMVECLRLGLVQVHKKQ